MLGFVSVRSGGLCRSRILCAGVRLYDYLVPSFQEEIKGVLFKNERPDIFAVCRVGRRVLGFRGKSSHSLGVSLRPMNWANPSLDIAVLIAIELTHLSPELLVLLEHSVRLVLSAVDYEVVVRGSEREETMEWVSDTRLFGCVRGCKRESLTSEVHLSARCQGRESG